MTEEKRQPHNPLESPEGGPEMTIDLNDGTQEQVSIIVVHHNQPEYLNICLQSIYLMSNLNNYEVIVVDNNSDQETQDYLDAIEEEGVKVIRNSENKYWSAACNLAVAASDPMSKYFIFMHADTVVTNASWIDLLVGISHGNGSGIVGTELKSYFIQKQRMDFVQEWCMLMTRECWDDVGPWPEDLPMVGHSFIMTLKSQMRGHKPQTTGNNIVHHYKAFVMDPSEYEKLSEKAMAAVPRLMHEAQTR